MECTELKEVNSGNPQGIVLRPILYLIFTADLSKIGSETIATFVDDTAAITSHHDLLIASENHNEIEQRMNSW